MFTSHRSPTALAALLAILLPTLQPGSASAESIEEKRRERLEKVEKRERKLAKYLQRLKAAQAEVGTARALLANGTDDDDDEEEAEDDLRDAQRDAEKAARKLAKAQAKLDRSRAEYAELAPSAPAAAVTPVCVEEPKSAPGATLEPPAAAVAAVTSQLESALERPAALPPENPDGFVEIPTQEQLRAVPDSKDAFCDARKMNALARRLRVSGLHNAREISFKALRVLGVGVGKSKVAALLEYLKSPGRRPVSPACVYYVNKGNSGAERAFSHHTVERPNASHFEQSFKDFQDSEIRGWTEGGAGSFAQCAEENGAIALGCNGMLHRGPTLFALLLTTAGCSPYQATAVANALWKENGISPRNRASIAWLGWRWQQGSSARAVAAREAGARLRAVLLASAARP